MLMKVKLLLPKRYVSGQQNKSVDQLHVANPQSVLLRDLNPLSEYHGTPNIMLFMQRGSRL